MATADAYRSLTEPQQVDGSIGLETPSNTRIHKRLKASDLEWLRGASVKYGAEARVLDISAGGLLLETPQALKPNSSVVVELAGPDSRILVPSRVLRCRVVSLRDILTYEGACAFKRPLTIPELTAELTSALAPPSMSVEPAAETSVAWGRVIVRFNDGRIARGYTSDFDPSKEHLHLSSDVPDGELTTISLSELKALFFVRDFAGDPTRVEANFVSETPQGQRMEVMFRDGELMVGSTQSYPAEGHGLFLRPADPGSNDLSVFVTAAGVQHMRVLSPERQHTGGAQRRRGLNRKSSSRNAKRHWSAR